MDDSIWGTVSHNCFEVHLLITFSLLLPYNRKSDLVSWESVKRSDLSNETQGHLHLLFSSQICLMWKLCQLWRLQVVWGQPFWQCTRGLCENAAVSVPQWLAGKHCCALGGSSCEKWNTSTTAWNCYNKTRGIQTPAHSMFQNSMIAPDLADLDSSRSYLCSSTHRLKNVSAVISNYLVIQSALASSYENRFSNVSKLLSAIFMIQKRRYRIRCSFPFLSFYLLASCCLTFLCIKI